MAAKRKRLPAEKDLTERLLSGDIDEDRLEMVERFGKRSAGFQQRKMERTALLRAAESDTTVDIESLPVGQVVQVYSLYSEVESEGVTRLCVVRKTLGKLSASAIVTGDVVRFRETGSFDDEGRPEAVIEQVFSRRTILTRTDSFKGIDAQPIVANADQMLIVAALREPLVKWGLVDRMLVAALAGSLRPVICLNKVDLARLADPEYDYAKGILEYYTSMGYRTVRTSVLTGEGLDELRELLRGKATVLAGHSGVGKSTLINALQPYLHLRVGPVSGYTGKGRHTTTSARRHTLDFGGHVIDTPGVRLFGLWGVTADNLPSYLPDVDAGTAPPWRVQSYERILDTLGGRQ